MRGSEVSAVIASILFLSSESSLLRSARCSWYRWRRWTSLPSSLSPTIFSCIETRRAWSCADHRSRRVRLESGRESESVRVGGGAEIVGTISACSLRSSLISLQWSWTVWTAVTCSIYAVRHSPSSSFILLVSPRKSSRKGTHPPPALYPCITYEGKEHSVEWADHHLYQCTVDTMSHTIESRNYICPPFLHASIGQNVGGDLFVGLWYFHVTTITVWRMPRGCVIFALSRLMGKWHIMTQIVC